MILIRTIAAIGLIAACAGIQTTRAGIVVNWTNAERGDDGILEPKAGTVNEAMIVAAPSSFGDGLAATKDGVKEISGNSITLFPVAEGDFSGQSIEDAVEAGQHAAFSFIVGDLPEDSTLEITGVSWEVRPNGNSPAHVFGPTLSQVWIDGELVGEPAATKKFAHDSHHAKFSRSMKSGDTFTARLYFAGADSEGKEKRKGTNFHRGTRLGNVRIHGRVKGLTPAAAEPSARTDLPADVFAVLEKNCYQCHGPEKEKGDVRFDTLSSNFIIDRAAAETWHDAMDVVSIGDMPPDDEPGLTSAERATLTEWIRGKLDEAIAANQGKADGVVMRRLNNEEYRHTLTDLLGVAADYGEKLPPDPLSTDGFRNDGATLGMSSLQLEYYLESAREAMVNVLVDGKRPPRTRQVVTESDPLKGYGSGNPGNRLGRVHYHAAQILKPPRAGDFTIRVKARAELVEGQPAPLLKLDYGNKISGAISFIENVGLQAVTSEKPQVYEFEGRAEAFPLLPERRGTETGKEEEDRSKYVQLVVIENALEDGKPDPKAPKKKKGEKKAPPFPEDPDFSKIIIESVEFVGNDYTAWPPEPHRRILFQAENEGTPEYNREVLRRFLRRAWRRPPTDEELATYLNHYKTIAAEVATPHEAWREILSVAISSPKFLFIAEPKAKKEEARPLTDHEIAARLSYFLWSSLPDAELSQLADEGKIREPGVIAGQVERMLADEKSSRFVDAFATQWLDLDGVDRIAVNPEYYPKFDEALKPDMIRESQAFFGEILRTDTSALQFLDADFTMANAALARHYGLEGPMTHEFERVSLKNTDRPGGVLGHAAFHLSNSDGGESHPIKRAVWIRERLLHDPPLPPPPNVPSLENIDKNFAKLPIGEQMKIHRQDPACNDCHQGIDPWGIALERFDALGLRREAILRPSGKGNKMDKLPVDTETTLPGGHEVDGLEDLVDYLLEQRRDQFTHALVNKMLTYALGRSLELEDESVVDALAHEFAENDYRLPLLIERIAQSDPFLTK